jgi:hypothetical protein
MVIKSYRYLKTLSLALAVELAMSSGLSATAIQYSQQQQPQNSRGELLALQRRLRFSVRGLRPSRGLRGGAARGGCLSEKDSLKLILPPVVSEQQMTKFTQYQQLLHTQNSLFIFHKLLPRQRNSLY